MEDMTAITVKAGATQVGIIEVAPDEGRFAASDADFNVIGEFATLAEAMAAFEKERTR
jgi:hypothetical protein